ncbi:hypothetical protein LF1_26990 [Rubripirellula obstinata]|uniref:PEP-CTERM protein-sorting domain-containing protein n=2 Tax=Rubripirellula obstinata TaxID=406547 RepID=A0A5B1CKU5_9BACT|nr:hypothetical protein LF1_26990 [Rubripirellula obstinata]
MERRTTDSPIHQQSSVSITKRPWQNVRLWALTFAVMFAVSSQPVAAQFSLTKTADMTLDSNALQLAGNGSFGRTINGMPYQQDTIVTHQGYQYAAWYHNGSSDENIFISRRKLTGNSWETIDTGYGLDNGDATPNSTSSGRAWDSHNTISMGISNDGRIHLAYDHHVDRLRYLTTDPGVATSSGGVWNAAIFKPERDALNLNGLNQTTLPQVTYPRFTNVGDELIFNYRVGSSNNGDSLIANYNPATGQWSSPRTMIQGRAGGGSYTDLNGDINTTRNAYFNGIDTDSSGRLHATWTWRERQQNNHDINYAYSNDGGRTWQNNNDQVIGTEAAPITIGSDGIEVVDLDIRQALINQQGQAVDGQGGVHAVMWHRRQEPGFEWEEGDARFSREDSAYHHYYRDPLTGEWAVSILPVNLDDPSRTVGSRPRVGVDSNGNVFALYTAPNGDFVIAGAERTAVGLSEWEVLLSDNSVNFQGTPQLDQDRLFDDGVLSVFIQEQATERFDEIASGSPLRVVEFQINPSVAIPEPSSLAALIAASCLAMRRRRKAI